MTNEDAEYVAARGVLLDALEALKAHQDSLILVGAQAVYLHTGTVEGTGTQMTTDSDLVLDVDLLADDPELTDTLKAADFTISERGLAGQWHGSHGIRVDLMAVPHQSNRPEKGARSAAIPPHAKQSARITPGLEPALVDNSLMTIGALDTRDDRTVDLRVAGPAALLTAKFIKLSERLGGRNPNRVKEKDVVDCYRLLVKVETPALVRGFESHRSGDEALVVTQKALAFLAAQRERGDESDLRALLARGLPGDLVALASYDALVDELLGALSPDLLTPTAANS